MEAGHFSSPISAFGNNHQEPVSHKCVMTAAGASGAGKLGFTVTDCVAVAAPFSESWSPYV